MEASGLGGPMLGPVLLPGLLAAGTGSLIFIGPDNLTGWARQGWPFLAFPVSASLPWPSRLGGGDRTGRRPGRFRDRWLGRFLPTYADRWTMLVVPLAGVAVAALAIIYAEATGKATSDVLFSGQNALDPLIITPPATPWARWSCSRSARGSPTARR